ncbi:MAG: hypothetical protein ABFS86_01350 [Planctomycetota bacterium]
MSTFLSTFALLPGLVLTAAAIVPAAPEEVVRREVEAVYADGDYQALPPRPEASPAERKAGPPRPRDYGGPASRPPASSRSRTSVDVPGSSGDLSGLVGFLAWTVVGTLAVLVVVWMAREWAPFWPGGPMRRRRRAAVKPSSASVRTAPVVPDRRPEHEVHAAEGRFPEAIHTLLLAALWEIGRRRRQPFESALTSREILPRTGLEAEARDALGGIMRTVEANLFGGFEVGRSNYEDCVDRYGRVMGALAEVRA